MLQSMLRPSGYRSSLRISMCGGVRETPGADQAILRAAQMQLEPCRHVSKNSFKGKPLQDLIAYSSRALFLLEVDLASFRQDQGKCQPLAPGDIQD